ncbi:MULTISPECIES: gliding motility protein GldB [unclassified Kaistella]|uniref:gliding motility lipoprotein GldB n=1 Tax=unclassified Kaistella TaxID=2762626 RepID=UPI0027374B6E|nr:MULTISPECIES: gliding motility protein GldB [unclassified Kaistella]MDP2453446.1 gliding motility protein GldB [Kaistella sp. SH11-4b]MDP2456503.1 gliding motility protein GldB [Kaistella sp. SH40-3]MDP2459259.1 gliding motility protein GldB [Kaistella sp. SH19-2b]
MKFFKYLLFSAAFLTGLNSCKKDTENLWKVEVKNPVEKVQITDISKELYDPNVSLEIFTQKYPFFQGTVPNEDFVERRKDPEEIKVYKEAISKIDVTKLNKELADLFSHIKNYFPDFKEPQVFLYSSALQGIMDPIFYEPEKGMLFIDIAAFMGENNPNYKGLEQYFQKSMNPKNILPKVSEIFAEHFVPHNFEHQKFIDNIVYYGKLMTLQDAFLPQEPDALKMNYTSEQYEWAKANEVNIWNYFVENNLVFSDDQRLAERFINPAPFSKFYTEIDNESSPQIGIFSGWQICRKFYKEKPETKLAVFLKMNAQEIFNQSNYKPKN